MDFVRLLFFIFSLYGLSSVAQEETREAMNIRKLLIKGRTEQAEGNNTLAFEHFSKARLLSQKLGYDELYFESSVDLANFYLLKGQTEKSTEIFNRIRPGSDFSAEVNCRYYHRKAFYYNQLNMLDSAIICSRSALAIAQNKGIEDVEGIVYNELGNIYEKYRMRDSSLFYYNRAFHAFDTTSFDYANAHYNMGRTYFHFQNYDSSIYHLNRVLSWIDSTDWNTIKAPAHFFLYRCYLAKGDSLSAFKSLADNRMIEIELLRHNYNRDVENLQVAYETEQKNLEIQEQKTLVAKEQREKQSLIRFIILLSAVLCLILIFYLVIRRKNKRLRQLVEENEFLLGEANHRIKNNLQIIVSLVARELAKKNDQEIDSLRNLASKIESIATLHQQLYLNDEKSVISLEAYVSSLCVNLQPIYEAKNIRLCFHVDELIVMRVTQSIYVGLLLNELVINSIKHAFKPDQADKRITISLSRENDKKVKLVYQDNGNGFESEKEPKLVEMLCRQLKAKYEIRSVGQFNFEMMLKL